MWKQATGFVSTASATAAGVREVIISAKYEHQAQMAKKIGADYVIRAPLR